MSKLHRIHSQGTALLELLVYTAIASTIATGIITTFAHLSKATLRLKIFREEAYGLGSTLALLQEGMRNQDAHTLPLPPRIHRSSINYYPPAFTGISLDGRDEESHAITFTEVIPNAHLIIKKWLAPQTIEVCSLSPFSWELIRTALAIGIDSISEITITHAAATLNNCYIIDFTIPELSLIAPQRAQAKPTKIIPLKRIYTLYRATSGALRYLSHVGATIIENQPLTTRSPSLNLNIKNDEPENFYDLTIEYQVLHRKTSAIHLFTHVSKLSLSNNALNGF